jgi:hypothetical protein
MSPQNFVLNIFAVDDDIKSHIAFAKEFIGKT